MTHVLDERNIAPARSKWAKYCTFRRAGAKNISRNPTTPHAGAVFLSPQLHPCPTGRTKLTLLGSISVHARKVRPAPPKLPKISAFSPAGRFFRGLAQTPPCWASIFAPMGATTASQHLSIASSKTDDTDAGGSLPRNETADTFASTKRPISGHFPAAKASPVSCTPHRAPAKASPVSSDAK